MVRLDRAGRCEIGPLAPVRRRDGRFGARAVRVCESSRGGEVDDVEDEDMCLEEGLRCLLDECELWDGGVLDS